MSWWNRRPSVVQGGSVLFRGRWVARPEDFSFVRERGVRMDPAVRLAEGGWRAALHHEAWGTGELVSLPDPVLPPPMVVQLDPRLTGAERAEVLSCRHAVVVTAEPHTGNVLADRKDLLRFLHAVMGTEGVAVVDHTAQAFWSRRALEYELEQDADLDIDAVYTIHAVGAEGPEARRQEVWLHTHGLREMGFCDLDVLDPSPDLSREGHDLVRALAFAVVEEQLVPGGAAFRLANDLRVRAVPVADFLARSPRGDHRRWRELVDDEHTRGHAVVCEPARAGGLLRRLLRREPPRSASFLSRALPEDGVVHYSRSATELMARRARGSLALFRSALEEVAELQPVPLVKIGYVVDGGGPHDLEHLWFQVHGFRGDAVDATLVNTPYSVGRLRPNERGLHPLEQLSDWVILTPAGRIDPRQTRDLRSIRENWDQLRAGLAEPGEG